MTARGRVGLNSLLLGLWLIFCNSVLAAPAWLQAFTTRNNVTSDSNGAVTLAGYTKNTAYLAPSAGLISVNAYDGDFTINVTVADWKILQSGYQAQINLFMAPLNYTLADYLSWPDTYVIDSQEWAYVRAKIYTNDIPNYTWSTLRVPGTNTNRDIGVAGSWQQQGIISLSRKGNMASGFLKVGTSQIVSFGPGVTVPTGPVLLGLQILYGFTYSVTVTNLAIVADKQISLTAPSPSPAPPTLPPLNLWSTNSSVATTWKSWFGTKNGVSFDSVTGAATLSGMTSNPGYLSPSAGLLSSIAFSGDFQINVTVSDYKILQSGYQAQINLFMAPLNYSLADYLSWPETGLISGQQLGNVRAKIFTNDIPNYTWSSMWVAGNDTREVGTPGSWQQQGVISLSRRGNQASGFLQVGSSPIVPFPGTFTTTTEPVLLGLHMLYGFNYSVTVSKVSIGYNKTVQIPKPPPPPLANWSTNASPSSWKSWFSTKNNVSFDSVTGAATLSGMTSNPGYLSPSAGLLSSIAFDGDFQINVTVSDYQILQSGYQAQINLFMAPLNYSLADYLSWPETGLISGQQLGNVRAKIFTNDIPNYTWSSMWVAGNDTREVGTPGSWQQQGVISLSRRGNQASGFLQVGSSPVVPFPGTFTTTTEPVLLGLHMLYGFNYSVTVSKISIVYNKTVDIPLSTWSTDASATSWKSWFKTRNDVSFDNSTGAATLAGANPAPGYLSPSAGLLSSVAFDGDFQVNVTISDYKILQSGYQAQINLFMAPLNYSLADYLSWPETGLISGQQLGNVRAKIFTNDIPNYTWSSMWVAGNDTREVGTPGSWQQQGVISLSRRGNQASGFFQVGSSPIVLFPGTFTTTTEPVLLGLHMLYGFNYSVTVSKISIGYRRAFEAPPPPPTPSPSPTPFSNPADPPASPWEPLCNITQLDGPVAVYRSGDRVYEPKGVGGGGAMSCFSMSPYSDLWLVGTDMGSLYRSTNRGRTWEAISHTQMWMTSDMPFAPPVGFSADGQTLFFAPCWDPTRGMPCVAKRSTDAGVTWQAMDVNSNGARVLKRATMPPDNKRPIRYWVCSSRIAELCYAATTGGLDRTSDKGLTWSPVNHSSLVGFDSRGSFMDSSTSPPTIYHATPAGIFSWTDGQPDKLKMVLSAEVRSFAAGVDESGFTLAYVDKNASFCEEYWALASIPWGSDDRKAATLATCGRLWISTDGGATFTGAKHVTYRVTMAENNAKIIYSTPSRNWDRNYGVRVFKTVITPASGGSQPAVTTTKVFDQVDLDNHYALWPASKLEYSAVGLDVGYWDGGYYSFVVNQLNASEAGGSDNFFLHVTRNGGATWEAPFTRYRDCGSRSGAKRWSSTGLEPTNFYKVAVHPKDPNVIYGGAADIKGIGSEDGGESWHVLDPKHQAVPNSIYDFAFDPNISSRVFITGAKWHDWPHEWYANPLNGAGGIFMSDDYGRSFKRVGATASTTCSAVTTTNPCNDMVNDFLAVGYDADGRYVYAGGHINGVARIKLDEETSWTWMTEGLLGDDLYQNETIVPDIQVDPDNGDVYILLTGNRAIGSPRNMLNQPRTGIYKMARGGSRWTLLRGQVIMPAAFVPTKPWQYPTAFAVDWTSGTPGNRTRMLLADFINNGQPSGSAGVWKTVDGGATWRFKQQADWPTDITFDPQNPNRAYLSSAKSASPWGMSGPGGWGYGGFMWSDDAGDTWKSDDAHPFVESMGSVIPDGTDRCKLWFATTGGGLMTGPAPPGLPGCSAK